MFGLGCTLIGCPYERQGRYVVCEFVKTQSRHYLSKCVCGGVGKREGGRGEGRKEGRKEGRRGEGGGRGEGIEHSFCEVRRGTNLHPSLLEFYQPWLHRFRDEFSCTAEGANEIEPETEGWRKGEGGRWGEGT